MNTLRCLTLLIAAHLYLPAAEFTRLALVEGVTIHSASDAYPGGRHEAGFLVDGDTKTEFSSNAKGTSTFVEFDLQKNVSLAGFRHVDRNDPAFIAASELVFFDEAGDEVGRASISHAAKRAGVTFATLPKGVVARRVRWQVTAVGNGYSTVGGAEVQFFSAAELELSPKGLTVSARAPEIVDRQNRQKLLLNIDYPYVQAIEAVVRVEGVEPRPLHLVTGVNTVQFDIARIDKPQEVEVRVEYSGGLLKSQKVPLRPAKELTVYILPHSHTDIGYTEIQTEIEDKQVNNLLRGIEEARRTANYPEGARFIWNVEVLWAADLYLKRLDAAQQKKFISALRAGQVSLNGMYLNELTGLCRPEELVRLFWFATQLGEQTGAPVDSAMISDVPGYTWGTVTAMAQAGIRYFSVAPNYFDRIGDILVKWENKPFWWIGPDGQSRVLVWIPYRGYAMSHIIHSLKPEFVDEYQQELVKSGYPYDVAYMRWAGHGDNAAPDAAICDFVKSWSETHAWPKFVIASTSEAFQQFERRYGSQLPKVRGDWTPYWEDGAGSSSLETGLNRASSDRLAQAEALWAMQGGRSYPRIAFEQAWNNVLLYSEHTWGAWCSVSEPARRETREQWAIKQSYAIAADRESHDLLSRALARGQQAGDQGRFDVFNTTSWPRTDLVAIPKYLAEDRSVVLNEAGGREATQVLRNGELVLRAHDLPPFAARRFSLESEPKGAKTVSIRNPARAEGSVLDNGILKVRVHELTGAIVELRLAGTEANFADTAEGGGLNDYLYFVGENAASAQRNGQVSITVGERGPLLASLIVESAAPGCRRLTREIRLAAGADCVEIINMVDKERLIAKNYHAKEGKESLNFGFPFQVPDGEVTLEVPFGVVRPDIDQIPSACKNWFTVGRWAGVANREYGVCCVTLDSPLVQVGDLTANLLNSQTNPDVWRKQVGPTQRIYVWAMNNHWGTNYRAYQEGPTLFRFVLRPHRGATDSANNTRFATGFSQPLLVTGARGANPQSRPFLRLSTDQVVVTGLKPSDDGKAVVVRLHNASAGEQQVTLEWGSKPRSVRFTDTSERPRGTVNQPVRIPAHGLTALRVEFDR